MMNPFLTQIFKGANFSEPELSEIIQHFKRLEIKKNTLILKQGQIANHYYIVESGIIRSFAKDLKDNAITTRFYSSGEIAMDSSSLFLKISSEEFMEAVTDIVAYSIEFKSSDHLFDSIEAYRKWGRLKLVNNLYGYKQRRLGLITKSAKERYLNLIDTQPQVIKMAPLKQIASYLGITDSSLSRIRKEIIEE